MSDQTKKTFVLKKLDLPRIVKNWPVPVPVPLDGGGFEEQTLYCNLEVLPTDELDKLMSMQAAAEFVTNGPGYGTPLLLRVLKGFESLRMDAEGEVVSDAVAIPEMLRQSNVANAITNEYWELLRGRLRKN